MGDAPFGCIGDDALRGLATSSFSVDFLVKTMKVFSAMALKTGLSPSLLVLFLLSPLPVLATTGNSQIPEYAWKMAQYRCKLMRGGASYDEAREQAGRVLSPTEIQELKDDWAEASKTEKGRQDFALMMVQPVESICSKEMDALIKDSAFN